MQLIYSFLDFVFPFEWLSPAFMKNALIAIGGMVEITSRTCWCFEFLIIWNYL